MNAVYYFRKLSAETVTAETCRFTHIGFHQETYARFMDRVESCLDTWKGHPRVKFCTLETAAGIARAMIPRRDEMPPDRTGKDRREGIPVRK